MIEVEVEVWFVRFELCLMHTPENWNQSVNWLDTKTINQMLSRNTIFYNKIQMHSSTTATTTKARIKEKKWTGNMQEINSPMRRWNLSYHRNRKHTSKKTEKEEHRSSLVVKQPQRETNLYKQVYFVMSDVFKSHLFPRCTLVFGGLTFSHFDTPHSFVIFPMAW